MSAIPSLAATDRAVLDFTEDVGTDGPVGVEGGRTRWTLGGHLNTDVRLIRAPAGTIEYKPEEMTIQVRAGTTVADLHAELASAGQRTCLPERGGTVGGAVAVGENDHRQLGRGRVRRDILQIRYASAEGKVVTGGGPTVKNVSGFDLPRLMTGALGTLGLLAEVTLRTNPIPASSVWLVADDADPFAARESVLRPSSVLWDGARTWVQLEGHDVDVEAERAKLAATGSFAECDGAPDLPAHRWSLRPSDLTALSTEEGARSPLPAYGSDTPDARPDDGPFVASIGVGMVYASTPAPARALDPGVELVSARMKAQFDPTGRLNPGRNPGRR